MWETVLSGFLVIPRHDRKVCQDEKYKDKSSFNVCSKVPPDTINSAECAVFAATSIPRRKTLRLIMEIRVRLKLIEGGA